MSNWVDENGHPIDDDKLDALLRAKDAREADSEKRIASLEAENAKLRAQVEKERDSTQMWRHNHGIVTECLVERTREIDRLRAELKRLKTYVNWVGPLSPLENP